jgi:arginine deiminase
MNKDIKTLYQEHYDRKFPVPGSTMVNDTSLTMLDADIMGCISTYLNGNIDIWRVASLGISLGELSTVLVHLEGEALEYFQKVKALAELTLWQIVKENNDA